MILWVRGDPFPAGAVNDLSLRDLRDFDRWLMRHPRSIGHWWELPGLIAEYNSLPDAFRASHPEAALLLAVRTWATLRKAGVQVSFDDVLGISPDEIGMQAEDADDPGQVMPHGFRAGNVQRGAAADLAEMDLEHEVWSRILLVMATFPGLTPVSVWDLPLFVWLGVAEAVDSRRKG